MNHRSSPRTPLSSVCKACKVNSLVCAVVLWFCCSLGGFVTVVSGKLDPPPPPPPPPPRQRRLLSNEVERVIDANNTSKVQALDSLGVSEKHTLATSRSLHNNKSHSPSETTSLSNDKIGPLDTQTAESSSKPELVVQLTETEIWDGSKWRAPGVLVSTSQNEGGRWTNEQDEICLSPTQQQAPKGSQWEGDWKILTSTSTRDAYGWEYSHTQPYPLRQRIWLRSIVELETNKKKKKQRKKNKKMTESRSSKNKRKQSSDGSLTTSSTRSSSTRVGIHQRQMPRWIRAIADDFNFKGFGMSFWKGIIFPRSFGVAFRIPLTSHFGSWDGNPALPKANLMLGVYYPPMVGIYISSSIRLAWVKWSVFQAFSIAQFMMLYFVWTFYRGLLLATSAMVFPLTRTLINPPFPVQRPWEDAEGPAYRRDVEERIGCSYSWRISAKQGYHSAFRTFHCYSPTVVGLWKMADRASKKFFPSSVGSSSKTSSMPRWIARRSAELAFEVAGPLESEPYFAGSTGLSLSGFYLRFKKQQPQQSIRYATTAALEDGEDVPLGEAEESIPLHESDDDYLDGEELKDEKVISLSRKNETSVRIGAANMDTDKQAVPSG